MGFRMNFALLIVCVYMIGMAPCLTAPTTTTPTTTTTTPLPGCKTSIKVTAYGQNCTAVILKTSISKYFM